MLRRFMLNALSDGLFDCPIRILKADPPSSDFMLFASSGDALLEVTEATDSADQRELTAFELSERADLIGTFGGRFHEGASGNQPERAWVQDVVDAIRRKEGKAIFSSSSSRHLVIYPNSNASSLMFDGDDELEARGLLRERVTQCRELLLPLVKGCQVHILGKAFLFLGIFGNEKIVSRAASE